jgi:hypothetical protein
LKAPESAVDDQFEAFDSGLRTFFVESEAMRKILLTAVLASGAALALLVAACKAPDGAGTARNNAPPPPTTTTNAGGANQSNANAAPGPAQNPGDIVRRVTPPELKGMMDRGEAVVVDVRGKDDYDEGHIKGAISIPRGQTAARLGELPQDKLIVFYCA